MLINCVAYENGRNLADITVEAISDYLQRPGCFVWVALKDPGPGELAVMEHEFGLHELAIEDARKTNQRPKIDEYPDYLFAVLHFPFYDKAVKAGINTICIHKGLLPADYQKSWPQAWQYNTVWDVGKAAKDWPKLNFIIYHGGYRFPAAAP